MLATPTHLPALKMLLNPFVLMEVIVRYEECRASKLLRGANDWEFRQSNVLGAVFSAFSASLQFYWSIPQRRPALLVQTKQITR